MVLHANVKITTAAVTHIKSSARHRAVEMTAAHRRSIWKQQEERDDVDLLLGAVTLVLAQITAVLVSEGVVRSRLSAAGQRMSKKREFTREDV